MADDRIGPAALSLAGVMARVAGWRPEEFWAATPADVRAILAGWVEDDAAPAMGRDALAAMMEVFPDG
ncbi:phage tail assembly chaperone [Sphingopyxis panaciterrae]